MNTRKLVWMIKPSIFRDHKGGLFQICQEVWYWVFAVCVCCQYISSTVWFAGYLGRGGSRWAFIWGKLVLDSKYSSGMHIFLLLLRSSLSIPGVACTGWCSWMCEQGALSRYYCFFAFCKLQDWKQSKWKQWFVSIHCVFIKPL